ncbi:MAG: DUF721 domain-containing protein [Lentisphaeria bacterium]|nr:DUF721 domain-containing protein [Lentisphaeria bacterium]
MYNRFSPEKREELRERHLRRGLLKEWYGDAYAANEMHAHSGAPKQFQQVLAELNKEIFSEETERAINLSVHWQEILGAPLCQWTRFHALENGVLYLEARHPAFVRELTGNADLILDRVNGFLQKPLCRELKFVPSGGAKHWGSK